MFCHQCGKEIGSSSKFCEFCGATQVVQGAPQNSGSNSEKPSYQTQPPKQEVNKDSSSSNMKVAIFAGIVVLAVVGIVLWMQRVSENDARPFSKPSRSACESGGGTWNAKDECQATWDNAMKICTLPTKEQWLSLFASCGADTTINSKGHYSGKVSGMYNCVKSKGFTEGSPYWSSSEYDFNGAWGAVFVETGDWGVLWDGKDVNDGVRCAH